MKITHYDSPTIVDGQTEDVRRVVIRDKHVVSTKRTLTNGEPVRGLVLVGRGTGADAVATAQAGTATIATLVTGAKHSWSGLGTLCGVTTQPSGPCSTETSGGTSQPMATTAPITVYPSGTVAPATAVEIFSSRPALLNCAVNSWSAASSSTGTAFRSTSPPAAVWDTIAIV